MVLKDIATFDDSPPPEGESPWVTGQPSTYDIEIVSGDPAWPVTYLLLKSLIEEALGGLIISLEHIGSTAVPGLAAKPVIDIDLIVAYPEDEDSWLPHLETAGFALEIREPWWYQHRCLTLDDPRCNLHVFPSGCPEAARHKLFRDWLADNPEDLLLYKDAKVAAAETANANGESVESYNDRKRQVIREIYDRAFRAAGLL